MDYIHTCMKIHMYGLIPESLYGCAELRDKMDFTIHTVTQMFRKSKHFSMISQHFVPLSDAAEWFSISILKNMNECLESGMHGNCARVFAMCRW